MILMDDRRVVIFVGPPGAGKGTQANLLEEESGFYHLESSGVIEEKFKKGDGDPVIEREKEIWRSGKLNTPFLVRQWIMEAMEKIRAEDKSLVLSGSPRTLYEVEGELPLLEQLYGSRNISIIHIDVTREVSIMRNSKRRICKKKRHPIPNLPKYEGITECPFDGSELITRALDTPETITIRYDTYLRDTAPVLGFFEGRGYDVVKLDGDNTIEAVHAQVARVLEQGKVPVPADIQ